MNSIPDFTEVESKRFSVALFECYGRIVPFQLAASELQLGGSPLQLTNCPANYWN